MNRYRLSCFTLIIIFCPYWWGCHSAVLFSSLGRSPLGVRTQSWRMRDIKSFSAIKLVTSYLTAPSRNRPFTFKPCSHRLTQRWQISHALSVLNSSFKLATRDARSYLNCACHNNARICLFACAIDLFLHLRFSNANQICLSSNTCVRFFRLRYL